MERIEWDLVVVGGCNTDYLVRGANLPSAGESVQGDLFQAVPGGKGANQAVAAARLGARTALVGRVGNDARGNELVDYLATEKVDTRYVLRDARAPTGVTLVMLDQQGRTQTMAALGANQQLSEAEINMAAPALRAATTVVAQLEIPLHAVMLALRLAHQAGRRTLLDPAPPVPLPDSMYESIDLMRLNAEEAEVLTGVAVTDRDSARRAAERLRRRGVCIAVVQAGGKGNLVVGQDGEQWLPQLPVDPVDHTGAGDALTAALAVLLAEGRSLPEAATFAHAAAAWATTQLGAAAGLPRRAAVDQLLAQSRVPTP